MYSVAATAEKNRLCDEEPVFISVLMSVYNGEKYLREAIDSVLAQSLTDFEFVIVNDGSTDRSGEILASYSDPRFKVLTINNCGLATALDLGLGLCSAEWVMRMDADDVAYPHRFAALLEDWESAGRPEVFGSGADYISEDGADLWSISMPTDDGSIRAALLHRPGTLALMHPTVLFSRQAVIDCGGYDPYFRNGQDYDLWVRMANTCRFGNSPRRLLRYRFQPLSDTALAIKKRNDGELHLGNWMKLLSLQKKILIDAGVGDLWRLQRDRIVGALRDRADIGRLEEEAVVTRLLTEAKIKFHTGKRRKALRKLLELMVHHPSVVANRFTGGALIDVSRYLIGADELQALLKTGAGPGRP